jgi:hypothetical protein
VTKLIQRFVTEASNVVFWLAIGAMVALCCVPVAYMLGRVADHTVTTADDLCAAQCIKADDYERIGGACYCCTQAPSHVHEECEEVVW